MESPLKPHLDGDSLTQIFPFQKYAQSSKPRVSCRYGRDRVTGKTNQLKHSCSLPQRNLSRSVRPDSRGQPGCGHFRGGSGSPAEGEAWILIVSPGSASVWSRGLSPFSPLPACLSSPSQGHCDPGGDPGNTLWEWERDMEGRRGFPCELLLWASGVEFCREIVSHRQLRVSPLKLARELGYLYSIRHW